MYNLCDSCILLKFVSIISNILTFMTETHQKSKSPKRKKKKIVAKVSHLYRPMGVDLATWQIRLRRQAAHEERLTVSRREPGVYSVQNPVSGQEYKVVFRGARSPWNYCSCMDFKTSRLGTCKHLEAVKANRNVYRKLTTEAPAYSSVYLDYRGDRTLRMRVGTDDEAAFTDLASKYFDETRAWKLDDYDLFDEFLVEAAAISDTFRCYDDALDWVLEQRDRVERERWVDSLHHEAFASLLSVSLYPYQEEGIRFAAKAGRAVIADEMGLGKTIQAIGTAQLLRQRGLVESVLILCPTSLKYQWKREIERFTGEQVHVIEGSHLQRREQYRGPEPYRIISYHAATNDIKVLGQIETDMVIIDEVQRLKNWDTQIARAARKIKSRYAVVLSGTPLENRLEELYSVVELVDQFALSPYYLFRDRYIETDEKGSNVGYKNLNELGERLKSFLIRRRKKDVKLQMPERQDKNLMVPMTKEQMAMHDDARLSVLALLQKWERYHFLSEVDRNRLMQNLQRMRMACDSTFVVDQKTHYDTKVGEVVSIISDIVESGNEKVVVFSQWERMARIIAQELQGKEIGFEFLHGGVPSVKRKDMVNNFWDDADCRVFLSTDAGSTGLNLQVASTIINVDLPWNPAVLEQRIARIYRLGQQNNIQVINLVAANTFEEQMLAKLRFKSALFEGVLDGGVDTLFANKGKFEQVMDDLETTMGDDAQATADEQPINTDDTEREAVVDETATDGEEEKEHTAADVQADEESKSHDGSAKDSAKGSADDSAEGSTESNVGSAAEDAAAHNPRQDGSEPGLDSRSTSSSRSQVPRNSRELVEQGVSFFQGLAESLKSPEATKRLVDEIVEENPETGETNIKIRVPNKEAVASIFSMFAKLMGGQ